MSIDCSDFEAVSEINPSFLQMSELSDPTRQTSSLNSEAQKEAAGVSLYMQYASALLVGVIPFTIAKVGEAIVKGSAFVMSRVRDFSVELGAFGFITEVFLRAIAGLPTAIGGALLCGGAVVFSKSQTLAWGQYLVEHPQEEKANTKLARYGAGDKPWKDFKLLVETYVIPSSAEPIEGAAPGQIFNIDQNLRDFQNFEPT